MRIAVIGLDGLSPIYLDKLVEFGALPKTKHIINKAIRSKLYALPPMTAPSWSSIMTGVNPGKHGIYDFFKIDKKDYKQIPVSSFDLEHPRIHEILNMLGMKSIVINPYPPYPLFNLKHSIQISHLLHAPKITYSPLSAAKYIKLLKPDKIKQSAEKIIEDGIDHLNRYVELVSQLLKYEECKLFWINLPYPDYYLHKINSKDVYHKLIPKEDKLFILIDKIIHMLDQAFDDILIVSDHGFSHYRYTIAINSLLYNHGLIVKTLGRGLKDIDEGTGYIDKNRHYIRVDNFFVKLLYKRPFSIFRAPLKSIYEFISRKKLVVVFHEVDPRESKAYLTSNTSFGVIVNDHSIKEYVKKILKSVQGIENVYEKHEIFNGPYVYKAPDLILLPDFDNGYTIGTVKITNYVVKRKKHNHHHPIGVFVYKGWNYDKPLPHIIPNYLVANIILARYGVKLSSWADGMEVLKKLMDSEIKQTSLYVKRWNLIKRLKTVRFPRKY